MKTSQTFPIFSNGTLAATLKVKKVYKVVVHENAYSGYYAGDKVGAIINATKKVVKLYGCFVKHTYNLELNRTTESVVVVDRSYKVGDIAVYDSYNWAYTGKIVSIGEKTVTVKHYEHSDRVSRLSIAEFTRRNYNFDAEANWKRKQEWND